MDLVDVLPRASSSGQPHGSCANAVLPCECSVADRPRHCADVTNNCVGQFGVNLVLASHGRHQAQGVAVFLVAAPCYPFQVGGVIIGLNSIAMIHLMPWRRAWVKKCLCYQYVNALGYRHPVDGENDRRVVCAGSRNRHDDNPSHIRASTRFGPSHPSLIRDFVVASGAGNWTPLFDSVGRHRAELIPSRGVGGSVAVSAARARCSFYQSDAVDLTE